MEFRFFYKLMQNEDSEIRKQAFNCFYHPHKNAKPPHRELTFGNTKMFIVNFKSNGLKSGVGNS